MSKSMYRFWDCCLLIVVSAAFLIHLVLKFQSGDIMFGVVSALIPLVITFVIAVLDFHNPNITRFVSALPCFMMIYSGFINARDSFVLLTLGFQLALPIITAIILLLLYNRPSSSLRIAALVLLSILLLWSLAALLVFFFAQKQRSIMTETYIWSICLSIAFLFALIKVVYDFK